MSSRPTVVVIGGGFAGLETVFYLRHKLGKKVNLRLVANDKNFVFKPDTIYIPFGADPKRFVVPLGRPMRDRETEVLYARARSIDCKNRIVETQSADVHFDFLVVASGAGVRADEIPGLSEHATSLWTAGGMLKLRRAYERLIEEAARGERKQLLFLLPLNNRCSSPLYELILMTDTWLRSKGVREQVQLTLATYEDSLIQAFGPRLDSVVSEEFAERRIVVRQGLVVTGVEPNRCHFLNGDHLPFDTLVSFPPHVAHEPYATLASDDRGFIRVDSDSRRVSGQERIFAVGDASDYPIKRAFLALLQADAAADHIAAEIDGRAHAVPFELVSACALEAMTKATFQRETSKTEPGCLPAVEVGGAAQEGYEVGVSPLWRASTRALGLHLTWRFGRGEPFHASIGWETMELGFTL